MVFGQLQLAVAVRGPHHRDVAPDAVESHPAFCGLDRAHLGDLIEEVAGPWAAQRESALHERRGHDRQRAAGAGPNYHLVFVDRVLITLVCLRLHLPHAALAELYGVTRPTVTRAIHEIRPLPARRGLAVPQRPVRGCIPWLASSPMPRPGGADLRVDGTEVQVRRPRAGRAGRKAFVSGKKKQSIARRSRAPPRPPRSATAPVGCCGPAPTGRAACATRPPCAPRASPSSSACTRR
ncbi:MULTISPECIES: transposase family protein [unclassified Streptomyces]|uniref:helix-turn-helix domain-containing protein n=1 Tax=unclassified Streptomyces TaxID=2593676 RepID=UPI0028C4E226|nr:transposase family protein [Streptomyces sp. S1A1-3]